MKSMCPQNRRARLYFSLALVLLLLSAGISAQTKKAAAKKPVAKKAASSTKDAKKPAAKASSKQTTAKKGTKSDPRKDKASAKKDTKKASAKDKARERDSKNAKNSKDDKNAKGKSTAKSRAESRREAAERRKAEEARRQAALAEKRRREQAAREARARKLAFERSLRTATVENIANDNPEGEDLAIRRAAVDALGNHAGTVVVMEAKTGKVVTIVNQEWAIKHGFKPCSTIKLVTGVAGINENIINDEGEIKSSRMELDDALAYSSNSYFQRVGVNMGSSKMIDYAKRLGLGERTGINVEGENPGRLPYGNSNARIYSHGDDFEVTPLQLAVMVSAISNGGKKVIPQVQKTRVEKAGFQPVVKQPVSLPQNSIEGVIPGMIGAAEYGTARRGVDASMGVAGKTGSCISKGSWVGLFASVAPVEDPKYSVVVITRGQGERGKYAAAIAGKVYQSLAGRMTRNPDINIARKSLKPKHTADPKTVTEEEEDDSDSPEAVRDEEQAPIIVGASQTRTVAADSAQGDGLNASAEEAENRPTATVKQVQPAFTPQKKLVQKTTQSKPRFKPVVIEFDRSGADTETADSEAGSTNNGERPRVVERPRIVKNK